MEDFTQVLLVISTNSECIREVYIHSNNKKGDHNLG